MNKIERLTRILRSRVILDTYVGDSVVGHKCDLCGLRWKVGHEERHHVDCALVGTAREGEK